MSSASLAADKQQATDWLRRGQAYESQGGPDPLAQALLCYEQSIALLRALPADEAARDLGIAHMNRGNVLQKLERLNPAVAAYDETIACLQPLAKDDAATCNSLGAAWMNRGHALQRMGTQEALALALQSHN